MSKCINKIAGYDSKIRAPRMLYDIDRALSEASLKEKEFAYHKTKSGVKNRPAPLVIPNGNDGFTVMPIKKNKDGSSEIIGTISAERQSVNGAVDYTITVAEMSNAFIGKGKGVELYLTMVEELLKKGVDMGSYGSPDYLSSGGMTTESAMRVWRSIYKNLDKHLEKFPNLKGAISLIPSNEKAMIFHKGAGKLKDGSVEENQYEQDIGSEPAYSIELYPDTYAKNVARLSKSR
jgi:hypothetical protein